jgi:PAS domain S-box-containing protein
VAHDCRNFFAFSPDIHCILAQDGTIVEANPAMQRCLGRTAEELRGQRLDALAHGDDRARVLAHLQEAAHGSGRASFQHRCPEHGSGPRRLAWSLAFDPERRLAYATAREVEPDPAQQQLEAVLESTEAGIVVQDHAGKVIHFNGAALRILGLTADQLLGKTSLDPRWRAIREDGTPLPGAEHPAVLARQTGRVQDTTVIGVAHAEGDIRWLSVKAVPLFKPGEDRPFQVTVTFHDTTEQRRLVRFLSSTLSALPSLVSYIDETFVYRYVNRAYEKWFGIDASECIGAKLPDILGQDAFAVMKPYLLEALVGKTQRFERTVPYRTGGERTVSVEYIPDKDDSGRINGIYAIVHDITEQERTKALLRRNEEELTRILDGLPAMIGYWNRDLTNRRANRTYIDYMGISPEDMKGKHIRDVLGPSLYARNEPYIKAVLAGEAQTFERELPLPSGEMRQTLASYLPDKVDGEVQGFFVIVTDISQAKRLEQERREFEAKLIASSRLSSLGEMAGGIAHEINNPLAIIHGKVARLQNLGRSGTLSPEILEVELGKINTTVQRIASIIRGLRAFSREGGKDPMAHTPIGDIVRDTLELCRARFTHHDIPLRISAIPDATIECRAVQISQVLMNLLSNAHDAVETLDERWIDVSVTESEQSIRIAVTDSGPGIPLAIRDRMLQPFFTTKEVGKGTGLGLSICKGIVDDHLGRLEYDTGSPHTRFVVELPKRQAEAKKRSA